MKNKKNNQDYTKLKKKICLQVLAMIVGAFLLTTALYYFVWFRRVGDWIVAFFELFFGMNPQDAYEIYHFHIRNNAFYLFAAAIAAAFFIMFRFFISWFMRYFNQINNGIDALLQDDQNKITLLPELTAIENKLNTVKETLNKRALEAQQAEQRKNDLIMYLAHDIRTPLTSVIGYLSLLNETEDISEKQRKKYTHITLDKANRLQILINELFEIVRYNSQQTNLEQEKIDLYYMLIQMTDELYPIFSSNGNKAVIQAEESLTVYGDSVKLARVFNNILKNAATYSYPNTDIIITAYQTKNHIIVSITNQGKTIPPDKINFLFDKFYRLDESRSSDTGGSGLGLAIAKEIITLHGGTMTAKSENETITITISLPVLYQKELIQN